MDSVKYKIKVQRKIIKYKYSYFEREENLYTSKSLNYALFSLAVAILLSLFIYLKRFH